MENGAGQAPSKVLLAESVACKKGRAGSKIHLRVPTTAWIVGTISTGVTAKRQEEEHTAEQLERGACVAFKTPPVSPC